MSEQKGSLGILVGGGPAPGINGVISAVTIEARRKNLKVYGIYDGYKWLTQGSVEELKKWLVEDNSKKLKKHVIPLRISNVSRIHFNGGSILRTSRTNPKTVKNGIENSVEMLKALDIKYMVTIGGDDTAFGASQIAAEAKKRGEEIKFAHVPKTIDNDLPLPNNLSTFGFQSARDLGSALVKNLMEDARVTGRWYTLVAMGRSAGHLALGIAKTAGATLAIIPEEFKKQKITVDEICDIFDGAILKRKAMGNDHGVMVIAEGVSGKLDKKSLENAMKHEISTDDYGHIQLADVDLGRIIKENIEKRFDNRGIKFRTVVINLGYILRCADPNAFDREYIKNLGYQAVNHLLNEDDKENIMVCVDNAELVRITFDEMLDSRTGKTEVRRVNTDGAIYKVARNYMVTLEKRDLEDPEFLSKMAKIAKIEPEKFKKKYEYLV